MPRIKRAGRRGTRLYDHMSGATISTIESGVTIGTEGIDLGDGSTTWTLSGGSVSWAGTSVVVDTGLTSIVAVVGNQGWQDSKVSASYIDWEHNPSVGAGSVSMGLVASFTAGSMTRATSGGSIVWLAYGT